MRILLKRSLFIVILSVLCLDTIAQENYLLRFLHVDSKGWFTFTDHPTNPGASVCNNNGNKTNMYKTYFKVYSGSIESIVNGKIEKTVKLLKTDGVLKTKEDNTGRYEYKEYDATILHGTSSNPIQGKIQFGKIYMNNVRYHFLKLLDNQNTLMIFN